MANETKPKKAMKVTKTMKYEIAYNKTLYNLLSDIQYAIRRVKNHSVTMAWDWQQFSFGYHERLGEYPKAKEILGKGLKSDVYAHTKEFASFVYSATVDVASQEAISKFDDMKPEVLRGEVAIPTFKVGGSFPMRAQQIGKITKETGKKYHTELGLLSRTGAKERELTTRLPVTLRTGKGASDILDRVIDGDYKLCDSRISKRKNKFYLDIAYQLEVTPNERDESRVMGVDLGIVNAVYMAYNFDNYLRHKIEGNETIAFRQRVEARRKSMLRQSKYAGQGRRGHGRKTLMKPTDKLRDKVDNFRTTTNHKYSKYIVETADELGCGVIQIEDLSGINGRDSFLKNWSYFELQTLVEYKAKECGIKVKKVAPKYTSQRCSTCGHIAEANRSSQAKFKCVVCEYEANADFNAARNIAEPRIEELIENELKRIIT